MNLSGNPIPGIFTYEGGSFPGADFKSPVSSFFSDSPKSPGTKTVNGIDLTFGGVLDNLPEGVDKGAAFQTLLNNALSQQNKQQGTSEFREMISEFTNPERQKRILDMTLDFQKEQMAEAGKYKALFGLPKQIMDSFTIPAAIAATGDIAAANTLAVAGTNIGNMYAQGVKSQQVNVPTTNYNFRSR